jgi:glycosyltransferase involved in cell wall biosynthesis
MRFSLIVATIGRVDTVDRLLDSLSHQTHSEFEVILVDQNPDDRLNGVGARHEELSINHVRSAKGLSRARNVGLSLCSGDVMAFPDDDCWYAPELLSTVVGVLEGSPSLHGVTGRCQDADGIESGGNRFIAKPGPVEKLGVFQQGVSITIFLRREVIDRVGRFDEELGAGSSGPWGAGEETDYLLRALEKGFRIEYDPAIVVGHERTARSFTSADIARANSYGMGIGRVWRLHNFPIWYVGYEFGRSLAGCILYAIRFNRPRSAFYLAALRGKFCGWWQTNRRQQRDCDLLMQ